MIEILNDYFFYIFSTSSLFSQFENCDGEIDIEFLKYNYSILNKKIKFKNNKQLHNILEESCVCAKLTAITSILY